MNISKCNTAHSGPHIHPATFVSLRIEQSCLWLAENRTHCTKLRTRKNDLSPNVCIWVHMLWMYNQVHIQSDWGAGCALGCTEAARLNLGLDETQRGDENTVLWGSRKLAILCFSHDISS